MQLPEDSSEFLDFVNFQLLQVQAQVKAIEEEDYDRAAQLGSKFDYAIFSIRRIIKKCRNGEIESNKAAIILEKIRKICRIQRKSIENLKITKSKTKAYLAEIKNRKNLINRYRIGGKQNLIFETKV